MSKTVDVLARYLPILEWGRTYNRSILTSDLVAAIIVTIMLIPQSLAYGMSEANPPAGQGPGMAGVPNG